MLPSASRLGKVFVHIPVQLLDDLCFDRDIDSGSVDLRQHITVTGYFRFTPVPGGSFLTHYFFKLLIGNLDSFDPVRRLGTLYFSDFLQRTKDFRGLLVKQVLLALVLIYFSYGSDNV